ncbi:hypothetical protein HK104_007151 [Borealophlyctis nickersoniae]|nr:hypothetical protein HK104_007151 [Borealophlyctis nickersoniae]
MVQDGDGCYGAEQFLRAAQLAETIEKAVKEMSQLMVEGNAVLFRFVLRRLEAGDEIPSLWRSNVVRQCFAATQRMNGDPFHPRTDQHTNPEVKARRDEYRLLRPDGLPWADGRHKSDLITAATKQYVTNAQVYTIYQLIPRLRKLVHVEIFERVPLPTSAKATKKIRAKVLSVVILCLQGVTNYDPTSLRDFIEFFVDSEYTTFILDAISYVLDDMQQNILKGRALFIAEKDPQTRRPHPSFVQAKDEFETWIPVHYAILQRYEEYARTPSARQYRPKLAPFGILPKYGFTPKFIIINTDRALYDLWSLAGWPEVEPETFPVFKGNKDFGWSGGEEGEGEEDDGGGGVPVADAFEDSDDEIGPTEAGTLDRTDGSGSQKRKRKSSAVAAEPPRRGVDPYFRPVDMSDGTVVWGVDPGRRDPIHAVSNTGRTYRVSLAHYYQLCGFTAARKNREKWTRGSPTVQEALNLLSAQTYKTAALATFDAYLLAALLPNLSLLLDFYFRRRHRRSNFDSYIRTQTAWETILTPFRNSVVALGAALFAHNSRGHATGPLKKLRQQLKIRAYALRLIGEFNTSRVCHLCEGFFDQKRERWWALRVCRDVCGGRIINRDYNAAKNILEIFIFMNNNGGYRPEPFYCGWDTLPPTPGVH